MIERTQIDDHVIADIKSRITLSDYIGRTVKLKRVGGEFVGLSPFKDERTPSFTVNDDKGFYHCFSSGKHGDIIEWVTETQGLNFRQAIDMLASETGTSVASAPAPTKVKSAPLVPVCHYEYQDETGFPYMRVTRFEPKTFRQFHWDCDGWANGKPKTGVLPYRLPEIVARPNDDIWLVEGEKDADTLASLGLLATTAPGGATAFPRDDIGFLKWFDGRRVYAIPDNDEAGAKWRERVAHGIADVKFLHLGGPKDVTDYIEAGHDIADLVRLQDVDFDALDAFEPVAPSEPAPGVSEQVSAPRVFATPFQWIDAQDIPRRPKLYGDHLFRKFVSLLVSPGGIGKSSLAIVEALAMASGRALLVDDRPKHPDQPLTVWYWNGEDPQEETQRRVVAAAKHHKLKPSDIGNRLYTDTGREQTITLGQIARGEITLDETLFEALEAEIIERGIDVFTIDPFVSSHRMGENDNNAIDAIIKRLNKLADRCNCAVEIVHHVRKPSSGNKEQTDVNDARGASALLGGVRSARVLNVMGEDIASMAQIDAKDRFSYFSVTNGKSNMTKRSGEGKWRHLADLDLCNGPIGESDHVGVVEYFEVPDALSGIPANAVEIALDVASSFDHGRLSSKSPDWFGYLVGPRLGIDAENKANKEMIRILISKWIESGVLKIRSAEDKNRVMREYLTIGDDYAAPVTTAKAHIPDDDQPF